MEKTEQKPVERLEAGDERVVLPWYVISRHVVTFLCFFAVICMYLDRFILSQALINFKTLYNWTEKQQSYILAAFYVGSMFSQVISGYLSKRFRQGKPIMSVGILLSSVACAITPICAASGHLAWMYISRLMMGLGQGLIYPAMVELLSHWVLKQEKAFVFNFAWSGGQTGTVIVLFSYQYLSHWVNVSFPFYLFGAVGLVWFAVWQICVQEFPSKSIILSERERQFISQNQTRTEADTKSSGSGADKLTFFDLLKHRSLWALFLTYFVYNWTFYLMMNNIPKFLRYQYGFVSQNQGVFSMLPYLGFLICTFTSGYMSDFMVRRGYDVKFVRRFFVSFGFLGSATLLVIMSIFDNWVVALVCLILITSSMGISKAGYAPNMVELSPTFAGQITSLAYIIVSVAGILSPIVSSAILQAGGCKNDYPEVDSCRAAWKTNFLLSAGVYVFGTIVWCVFLRTNAITKKT